MRTNTDFSLKLQFDKDAELYDKARPHYPAAVFNSITSHANLSENSKVLEVGCGSGQATYDLGIKGYEITALEPGSNLATLARKNCTDLQNVTVFTVFFEDWKENNVQYDAVISANAWHWIDLNVSYMKAATLLKSGGVLALFWNFPEINDPEISKKIEAIVKNEAPQANGLACYSGVMNAVEESLQDGLLEFKNSQAFGAVTTERYNEELSMTSQEFIDWVGSYSNIQNLKPDVRKQLNLSLKEFINAIHGQRIIMSNQIVLRTAHKLRR